MKKNVKKTHVKRSGKTKSGKKYICDTCGVVLSVDNECSCDPCDLICCNQNMRSVVC